MSRSLGSQLSAGMSHQLKTAKMVIAHKITPAYQSNKKKKLIRSYPRGKQLCLEGLTKLNVPAVTGKKKGETWTANTIAMKNAVAT